MRFFQPSNQNGLARILTDVKTNTILAPGIISLGLKSRYTDYAGFIASPIASDLDTSNIAKPFVLKWNINQSEVEFYLELQPFYPSYVPNSLSNKDFREYVEQFLTLSNIEQQIFTLPFSFVDSNLYDSILETDCSLFILTGLQRLFYNQKKLSYILVTLREKLPPDIAVYLPGFIPPSYYSFLIYAGIDFFDNGIIYSDQFLTKDHVYSTQLHPKCYCPYCTSQQVDLVAHNELILLNTLAEIRYSIKTNQLRTVVERDVSNVVSFGATLKHFDFYYPHSFAKRFSLRTASKLICSTEQSLFHPAIVAYRERLRERYKPHGNAKVVILFPCSAKKPYSISHSHILYRKAIKEAKINEELIDEFIVTSPLGVVPRELENIYPPRFYDIPVAGHWTNEEIDIAFNLLASILRKYEQDIILINHMHGQGYDDIFARIKEHFDFEYYTTSTTTPTTSKDSLNALTKVLKELAERLNFNRSKSRKAIMLKKLQAIADFQYGSNVSLSLFDVHVKLKGRFPYNQQIFSGDGKLLGTLRGTDGYLSLSIEAAQKIIDKSRVNIELTASKIKGSNIYAPGVAKADPDILPSDEVFIINENQVIGTGVALMSGSDINKMHSGIVAKVKKKRK